MSRYPDDLTALEEPKADVWRPIAEAPMDGTRLEVWLIPESKRGRAEYARWSGRGWRHCGGTGPLYGTPTHFRYPPKGPQA